MVKIYDTDTVEQMAYKIFHEFELHNSCSILGFIVDETTMKLYAKGEMVWREIEKLDTKFNCRIYNGKKVRNYKYAQDSIGGTIAQKIFRKDVKMVDKQPRWTIWRTQ